jgi:beta-glucosidase
MLAHRRAYEILKATNPKLHIGIAAQLADMQPTKPKSILNKLSISLSSWGWNWWFLNRIKHHQDFIGVNYYFTQYQNWLGKIRNPKVPVSDLGWYMEPSGIARLLTTTWQRYHTPLIITENGVADSSDKQRQWWLEQTMPALEEAITSGVDLRGYLHWSLLDNFEWAYGWWPEFGLVHVDRATVQRSIRPSAYWLADYIKNHE